MKRLVLIVALSTTLFAQNLPPQAAFGLFTYTTDYNSTAMNGYVVVLDLSSGTLIPQVTTSAPSTANCSSPDTVYTTRTQQFEMDRKTFVAITANTGPGVSTKVSQCGIPDGLIVSNYGSPDGSGVWVNWPQSSGPVLYFQSRTTAQITDAQLPTLSTIQNAIAGSTTTGNYCSSCKVKDLTLQELGTLLVKDGGIGDCAIPKNNTLAARGAIGLDATNRYLIIVVIEAADGSNEGLHTPSFAALVQTFGAHDAINLDGGGSTVFDWPATHGVPNACPDCYAFFENKQVPPNPDGLRIMSMEEYPLNQPKYYSSQPDGRPVYASIGFTLQPVPKGKSKK